MPFIMDKEQIEKWLDPDLKNEDILHYIKPYDKEKMKAHSISRKFNYFQKEGTNVAEICERVEYPANAFIK